MKLSAIDFIDLLRSRDSSEINTGLNFSVLAFYKYEPKSRSYVFLGILDRHEYHNNSKVSIFLKNNKRPYKIGLLAEYDIRLDSSTNEIFMWSDLQPDLKIIKLEKSHIQTNSLDIAHQFKNLYINNKIRINFFSSKLFDVFDVKKIIVPHDVNKFKDVHVILEISMLHGTFEWMNYNISILEDIIKFTESSKFGSKKLFDIELKDNITNINNRFKILVENEK